MAKVKLTQALLEELCKAIGMKITKRTKVDSNMLEEVASQVADLPDDDWAALSNDAKDWYNQACDILDAGDDLPGLEEAEEPKDEKPARGGRGRGRKEPEPEPEEADEPEAEGDVIDYADVAEGDEVTVISGDTEVTGVVSKKTTRQLTLKVGRKNEVFKKGDIDEILGAAGEEQEAEEEEAEEAAETKVEWKEITDFSELAADQEVQCKIEDDEFEGKVVTVTKERRKVVSFDLDIDGETDTLSVEDFVFDEGDFIRVKREVEVEAPAKEDKPAGRGRGRGRAAAKDEPAKDEKPAGRGRGSQRNPGGAAKEGGRTANATQRVREIIAENLDASLLEVGKAVAKEGLEIKDSTLGVVFSDMHKVVAVLKNAGHME